MTIEQAIYTADSLKPNKVDEKVKIEWLSYIDKVVADTIIRKSKDGKHFRFEPYTENTDTNKKLLVPDPYSQMYIPYLHSQVDLYDQDYNRYQSSTAAFYSLFNNYAAHYNREHKPNEQGIKVF